MELWDIIFLFLGRLIALVAVVALFKWIICIKFSKPKITFGNPIYKDERAFGRTWYVPISNACLKGFIDRICRRRDIAKCRIRGKLIINGRTKIYEWGTDPVMPITLPSNSEPYELDLVNKKQGYEECVIGATAMGDSELLPANSTIAVKLSVIEGNSSLASAEYSISNYGDDISGLQVFSRTGMESQREKLETEKQKPMTFNPLSLGMLFFGFCLTLWGAGLTYAPNAIMGWITISLSACFGLIVLIKPFRDWLNQWVRPLLLVLASTAFALYMFGNLINWLKGLSEITGVARYALFSVGFGWLYVFLMVVTSQACQKDRRVGLVASVFFGIAAAVHLFSLRWLEGLVLLVFGVGVLFVALGRWKVFDKFSFW